MCKGYTPMYSRAHAGTARMLITCVRAHTHAHIDTHTHTRTHTDTHTHTRIDTHACGTDAQMLRT